ncbi:MAG: PAS domain S-box protein, partial [Chthoniobacterales bacterium]
KDAELAMAVLRANGIPARSCRDLREAADRTGTSTSAIIIAEEALIAGDIALLLEAVSKQPPWSDLPLIVLTSSGGEAVSVRINEIFGTKANVTLLERPLHAVTLVSATRAALRARQRQYEVRDLFQQREAALSGVSDAFSALDAEWRYLYVNDAAAARAGVKREEMIGRNIWEIYPDAVGGNFHKHLLRAVETQQPESFEQFYEQWDCWLETRIYPAGDAGVAVFRANINERKHQEQLMHDAERKVHESEAVLRLALEAAGAGTFDYHSDSREMRLGPRARQLLGFRSDGELSMHEIIASLHRDDRGKVLHALIDALRAGGEPINVEFRISRPRDGAERWIAASGRALAQKSGAAERCIGTVVDVTERKRHEQQLIESERRFRTMADTLPQLAWIANADGFVSWFNRRWYEYTGTTADEMTAEGWKDTIDSSALAAVLERWNHSVATGEPFEMVFPLRGADGLFRPFLTRGEPLKDNEGRVVQWFGTNTNIDELKRTQDELQEAKRAAEDANRSKDRFLAMISHELRTPLTPVLMMVGALQRDPAIDDAMRTDLEVIHRNIELEALLIDDLLDLTRVAHGKLELHHDAVDIHGLLSHALSISAAEIGGKQLCVIQSLDAKEHHSWADAARLQQVFWNLIKNAVKFTPPGGEVHVRTKNEADHRIVIEICDTGIGIDPRSLPRIFDAFEQGGRGITTTFGGMGLGLAISKSIVDLHHGSIAAHSSGRNCGATFTVTLQAIATSMLEGPVYAIQPAMRTGSPAHILLVEDHEDTARVLSRMLERAGYVVAHRQSIRAAREIAANEKFDVLISDLGLPDGSGVDLMRELREHNHIVGIALSGFGTSEDLAATRAAGFAEHLVKPVDWDRLRIAVERATALVRNGELSPA